MAALKDSFPAADHVHIKKLQEYVLMNSSTVDECYYNSLITYIDNILVNGALENVYINVYNKNIFLNIVYNDTILRKIKYSSKSGKGSIHYVFLDKLIYVIVKAYLINIKDYSYRFICMRMIYLLFLNKENDHKTPLMKSETLDLLVQKHDILVDIIVASISDTYKDISKMCVDIASSNKKLFPLFFTLDSILEDDTKDSETKIKYISCLDISYDVKRQKQNEFTQALYSWIKNPENLYGETKSWLATNNTLSLLNQFVTAYDEDELWLLLTSIINKILPFISGDPNSDINNEFKITLSFKIYKNVIDIMVNMTSLHLKFDYIHTLLLKLSNSACIHITVPVYRDLLKNLGSLKLEELIDSLNSQEYTHFGRRFGAIPFMYQHLYAAANKYSSVQYTDNSLSAMSFEIKLAVLPYLNIVDELNLVFNFKGKEDYVVDTYIVRFLTGLVAYIISKLKKKNYKHYKDSINLLVAWINEKKVRNEKLLLSILTQLVKYKSYLSKLSIDWEFLSQNKNWLIRKAAAELFYACNSRGFALDKFIDEISLNKDANQLQFYVFVLNEHTAKYEVALEDAVSLSTFFEAILFKNDCFFLHLQVFKNINESKSLKSLPNIKQLVIKYSQQVIDLSGTSNGVTELIVREVLKLMKGDWIMDVLNSPYYELALDYIIESKNKNLYVPGNDLVKLYEAEKYDFIKLKILKILEFTLDFTDFKNLTETTKNHDLKLEFEIFEMENFWDYYNSEDAPMRVIALKKAIFSSSKLKQYQFENDRDELVAELYTTLNLPKLNETVFSFSVDDIQRELTELFNIIVSELCNNDRNNEDTDAIFEKDDFHNISTLWWYIYLLTKRATLNINPELKTLKTNDSDFDVRILMLHKITGYKDAGGFYAKCMAYL